MTFQELRFSPSVLRALSDEGYSEPTPIQATTIPQILDGRDVIGTAQTGTGKTAAFCLPLLELMSSRTAVKRGAVRTLVLTPTRELALQVELSFRTYGRHLPFRSTSVLGGVSMGAQIRALGRRPDILVATPGRLLDLMQQRHARLDGVEFLVLDEADRMLDMGFIDDVRYIASQVPKARQTLMFSATMPSQVAALARELLRDPVTVQATPPDSVSSNIEQKVLFVDQADKGSLLTSILKGKTVSRALVFTTTRYRADRVAQYLQTQGISSDTIHSDKNQSARQRALAAFDTGRVTVLVATDIVSRGIDVAGISHVINYELPPNPESYIHRIGRTARAGATGIALSFCGIAEVSALRGIERLMKAPLAPFEDHPYHSEHAAALYAPRKGSSSGRSAGPRWRSAGRGGRPARRFPTRSGR